MTKVSQEPVLTDNDIREEVIECLAEHISINAQGAFNQKDLFNILVRAASKRDTIENTSKSWEKVPCGNDIRYHLGKINSFEELETELNLALKSQIPRRINKGNLKMDYLLALEWG